MTFIDFHMILNDFHMIPNDMLDVVSIWVGRAGVELNKTGDIHTW